MLLFLSLLVRVKCQFFPSHHTSSQSGLSSLILFLFLALLTGKMASPYSLRSRDGQQSSPVAGPPEVIPCRPGTSREGVGASNSDAQTAFLEMVGLLEPAETISTEPTLSPAEATVLSSALNHDFYDDVEGEDKYFTPDEVTKLLLQTAGICRRYALRSEEAVQQGTSISSAEAGILLDEYRGYPKVCCCAAHTSFRSSNDRFYADCLGRLISLPPVLTDHYGSELAEALLPFLFQKADHDTLMVRKCGIGSPYAVNFVLMMPSGRSYQFTGRPDFTINSQYFGSIARFTLRGVGEVQSPPGARRRESKTAALSQAGIYTVGQFVKPGVSPILPAIVLHKDKTVQVAMASLNGDNQTTENSLGSVAFKLVGQVDPVDLKDMEGLRLFSGLLKGVMDVVQQPITAKYC